MYTVLVYMSNMHKKDIRKQVLLSREDIKILDCLKKKYGSSEAEIFRRALRCLMDKEGK